MKHPVMRAAEAVFGQYGVGIAGEIAIGEEQKLNMRDEIFLPDAAGLADVSIAVYERDPSAARAGVRVMSAMLTYLGRIDTPGKSFSYGDRLCSGFERGLACSELANASAAPRKSAFGSLQDGIMAELVPFHDRDGFIWMDGKLLPGAKPTSTSSPTPCTMAVPCSRASAPMAARSSS